jgi:hypothetical protein
VARTKIEIVKNAIASPYWLILALGGAFFSFFALNRGGVVVFIELGSFFLLLNFITRDYQIKRIPLNLWVTAAICFYLILSGYLVSSQQPHTKSMIYTLHMLSVVFVIHCLSRKKMHAHIDKLIPILISIAVCWQFVTFNFWDMPYGTFTNPHYLSNFSMLVIPLVVYYFVCSPGRYKIMFVLIGLMAADLLLQTGSRPAILGLILGTLFVLIFLTKSRLKWIGISVIFLLFVMLYITDYAQIFTKIKHLIFNLGADERVPIWIISVRMFKDNSFVNWIFGNGIGSFRLTYPQYAASGHDFSRFSVSKAQKLKNMVFPHFYPFELLYENGFIGMLLVSGGLIYLLIAAIQTEKNANHKTGAFLMKCMIVVLLSWLFHSNLTFPFYSKYAQYSLGFILGTLLVILEKPNGQSKLERV